ncbi:hypothetical protein PSN45_000399 [Yamadazyma tenuis]|nr:hypothetical protein PSN45_000399 [Yamadazyma tenuis]
MVRGSNKLAETIFTEILSKVLFKTSGEENEYIGSFAVITIVKSIKTLLLGQEQEPEYLPIILDNVIGEEDFVPDRMETNFLDKFFSLAHNRGYFIDHVEFFKMMGKPVGERNSWEKFCWHMALAIGCRLVELLHVTTYPQPEVYLRRALKELVNANMNPLRQSQACLLIAVFISRSYHLSFYVSAWELTGCAIRKLVQFGYFRKQPSTLQNCWNYEFIKRMFWSAYNYDKLLSLSLGRPCSIVDNFVDLPYPISIDFPTRPVEADYQKLYQLQLQQQWEPNFKQSISGFTSFIATTNIRIIETRIHLLLYSVNNNFPIADTIETLKADIDNWYHSLPSRDEFEMVMNKRESYDFLDLSYYRARLILLLPLLMRSHNSERDSLLDQACLAAGKICSCYKKLYRDSILEFSIVALHTVFLAGITMVYYLKNKGEPTFINIQNDLRAGSSLLFVFSERWVEAKTYSDLFDSLLEDIDKIKNSPKESNIVDKADTTNPILDTFQTPNNLSEDFWDQILENIKHHNQG